MIRLDRRDKTIRGKGRGEWRRAVGGRSGEMKREKQAKWYDLECFMIITSHKLYKSYETDRQLQCKGSWILWYLHRVSVPKEKKRHRRVKSKLLADDLFRAKVQLTNHTCTTASMVVSQRPSGSGCVGLSRPEEPLFSFFFFFLPLAFRTLMPRVVDWPIYAFVCVWTRDRSIVVVNSSSVSCFLVPLYRLNLSEVRIR